MPAIASATSAAGGASGGTRATSSRCDALSMLHSGCNLARAVHRFSRRRRCFYRQKHRRSTRTLHWQSQWRPIHSLLSSATPPRLLRGWDALPMFHSGCNLARAVHRFSRRRRCFYRQKHRRSTRTLHWQSQWHPIHALLSSATPPPIILFCPVPPRRRRCFYRQKTPKVNTHAALAKPVAPNSCSFVQCHPADGGLQRIRRQGRHGHDTQRSISRFHGFFLSLSPCSVCPVRRLCFSITASPLTL